MSQHTSQAWLKKTLFTALSLTVKPLFNAGTPVSLLRHGLALSAKTTFTARAVRATTLNMGSVPSRRYASKDSNQQRAILYLHGGAYRAGSWRTHASLTSHLAQRSGYTVYAPNYRLAPEHPFPAALEDALMCYQHLLQQGYLAQHITVMGDSAGGGLTLSLLLALREQGIALPAGYVLLSPWADLTHPHREQTHNDDAMLTWAGLDAHAASYAGTEQRSHPGISPALGQLEGLPPGLIIVGTREILLADAEHLHTRLQAAQSPIELQVFEGMWHVFPLHAGQLKEADDAVAMMAEFARQHTVSND